MPAIESTEGVIAADIGVSDAVSSSSTGYLVGDGAVVGPWATSVRGRSAANAASTSAAPRLGPDRTLR